MTARRVLILSAGTGGGHDMRADALKTWIRQLRGDSVNVLRWQPLEQSSRLDHFGVWLYNRIQRGCPRAHHLYFNFLEIAGLHRHPFGIRGKSRIAEMACDFRPEVVVSTHAHLNHGYFEVLKHLLRPHAPRCLIYCGELAGGYGFSRHWVNPRADGFIASLPACAAAAVARGMPEDRVSTGGVLLRPEFFHARTSPVSRLCRLLRRYTTQPLVLLGTGANGANNHLRILRHLPELPSPVTFLALCGRNHSVRQRLRRLKCPPHRVLALGPRDDMAELLQTVDMAFIRPGSGTTSECIQCACPIIFNGLGGIMPQELCTLRGVAELGVDPIVVSTPRRFGTALSHMLAHGRALCHSQHERMKRMEITGHPEAVVREVLP